jgi:hypothetical protein
MELVNHHHHHHHQWRYSPDRALASLTGFVTGIYDVGFELVYIKCN